MPSDSAEMSQEFAQRLFSEGAAAVLLNVPPGTEIGIDLHSWHVGPKFKGIKMIPPGLHFIYYSAVSKQGQTAPRTGFFHYFEPKEVLVRVYQPLTEDFSTESCDQVERIRAHLRNLDKDLGVYPLDTWRRWVSLSQHISQQHVAAVTPLSGLVCSVPVMVPVDSPGNSSTVNSDARKRLKTQHNTTGTSHNTSIMSEDSIDDNKDGSSVDEEMHSASSDKLLTDSSNSVEKIDNNSCDSVSPCHRNTQHSIGSSSATDSVIITACDEQDRVISPQGSSSPGCSTKGGPSGKLPELESIPGTAFRWFELPKRPFRDGATPAEVTASGLDSSYLLQCLIDSCNDPLDVLSELQLSFIVFLVGQSWSGWERWKLVIDLLCRAEAALLQHTHLFTRAMAVLHFQIQEVPEDLFVDIVEQQNFLAASLATLFANISDNSIAGGVLPTALVDRARKFRLHLTARFAWDFDLDGNEEDAPVVVEL